MSNLKLTKLRLQHQHLKREADRIRADLTLAADAEDRAWLAYLDEAERQGLCRVCLKPLSEGEHQYVLWAADAKKPRTESGP